MKYNMIKLIEVMLINIVFVKKIIPTFQYPFPFNHVYYYRCAMKTKVFVSIFDKDCRQTLLGIVFKKCIESANSSERGEWILSGLFRSNKCVSCLLTINNFFRAYFRPLLSLPILIYKYD